MADDQVVTNIVARADFSDLIANVRKVTTTLAAMQQQIGSSNKVLSAQINALNRSFGDTLRSTGQFSTHFVSLNNDVEAFGKRLDGGKLKLRDYFSTLQTHTRTSGGLIRDLARQQVQLQNAIVQPLGKNAQGLMQFNVHIPQGLDRIKSSGALARQEMQILNRVMQEGAGQLINWGKNTQWAGRQLTVGLTVPIAAFGAAASKAFREADAELVRLTKVYGGLAATSSVELAKIRSDVTKTAAELAKAYGASFKDTIALAADIAATGKQGNELLKSTQETTRLSILGEVDRQDAMKTTLALQSAFKQNTTELAESINFLNAVENQTSTTLQDLTEAIPKAGPVIKGLGGEVEDLALFLVAMKEGGINATEGANALKSALASIINPTKVAKGMFKDMGISLEGIVNGNAGNVKGMIFDLQTALDRLDPLKKQQAIEQLFGKFQFARMSALFENLGKQGSQTLQVMDLMKASSAELAGIADRELKQVTESASGKYRRAIEGLKADLAGIGEEFLKVQTFFIKLVSGIVNFLDKLPGPIKSILTFLAGLTAVAGPLIMLTGVLANFLGYVIKGAFHLKALFKGGEGWKLLTPEILAANQAGSLIEKTFYSDAKAALALAEALQVLSAGMTSIQSKMNQGVVSVQPMLSTVAGSMIRPPGGGPGGGGGPGLIRVVDPRNPLVGPAGTRASSHMVPRSGMSQEERASQTIHSFLPGPIPVNQAIGANPQIYAAGDLPAVPGLSTILGRSGAVSTGVVAGEAAKWHSMVGALSMMTKTEVSRMKTQLSTTGTVTSEFTQAFGSLLPQMTDIAASAASQSAIIVAEAKAGTISVATARQRIIALNMQVEQLMAQATMGTASSLGRTAVLTGVPTLDQPVVDPRTGKSNMRELFKKTGTRSFVDDLARLMGVRTWGAGYSTHTTRPMRLNSGGLAYLSGGNSSPIVPGPNVDKDVVPAILTPGEFVVNRKATAANLPLLQAINGRGSRGPRYNDGADRAIAAGVNITNEEMRILNPGFRGNIPVYRAKGGAGTYNGAITDPAIIAKYPHLVDPKTGLIGLQQINSALAAPGVRGLPAEVMLASIDSAAKAGGIRNSAEQLLQSLARSGVISAAEAASISDEIHSRYSQVIGSRIEGVSDRRNPFWAVSNRIISTRLAGNADALSVWSDFSKAITHHTGAGRRSTTALSLKFTTPSGVVVDMGRLKGSRSLGTAFLHSSVPKPLIDRMATQNLFVKEVVARALSSRFMRRNNGGMIPGYNSGGMVGELPLMLNTGSGGPVPDYGPLTNTWLDSVRARSGNTGSSSAAASSSMPSMPVQSTAGVTELSRGAQFGLKSASFAGQTLGFFGGSALGSKLTGGNQIGSIIGGLVGSSLLSSGLNKLIGQVTGLGGAAGGAAGKTSLLTKAFSFFIKMPGPVKLLAVLAGVGIAVKSVNDQIEAHRKVVNAGFGISEESAKKLGLAYKKVGSEIDDYRKKIELANAAAAANKYATSKEAGAGINITQPEMDKLVKQSAKQFPLEIKALDTANEEEVYGKATNLKADLVARGMSVENANELILALLKNTNKAKIAIDILADEAFSSLDTQAKAAQHTFKTFADIITNGNFDQLPTALQTASDAFTQLQKSMVNTTDNSKELVSSGEAYEKVLKQIVQSNIGNQEIGNDGLIQILEQNKALSGVINSTDTFASILAKVKLSTSGIALDFQSMSDSTAIALSVVIEKQKDFLSSAEGPFAEIVNRIKETGKLTEQQLIKNANKTKESLQAEIKLRQKNIQKIKDEADAKKKALEDETAAEDFLTQIRKKQLEYSEALASGDMASAAQIQLDIQSMTGARQLDLAKSAIDAKADKDIKKQELKIEALSNQLESLDKNLQTSLKAVEASQKESTNLQLLLDELNMLVIGAQDGMDSKEKDRAVLLEKKFRTAGFDSFASQVFQKSGGKYLGSEFVPGGDYSEIQKLAGKALKTATNGGLLTSDPEVLAILKSMQKGELYAPATGIFVSQDPVPFENRDRLTVTRGALDTYGVSPLPKTVFRGEDKVLYRIVKDLPLKAGDENYPERREYEVVRVQEKAMGGMIKNFMPGGNVTGPGTGTSDSIPAMLSNGEYVIKADSVKKYGINTFDALNAGRFAEGGSVASNAKPEYKGGKIMGPVEAWQEANKEIVKIKVPPITANFDTNSYELNKKQKLELRTIAKDLVNHSLASIVVQGHTDSVGKGKDNEILSQNRANAIAEYMSKFVPGTSFTPVGYGEYSPLVPNTTSENKARNRRAELFLPDKYKTIYPEYVPEKHNYFLSKGRLDGGGEILGLNGKLSSGSMQSTIDWGNLLKKIKSGLGFAEGGPINTSALITPSIPYYMKDGGIMDSIRGGYRFFENAMNNGKNPASSILMDYIRQAGYLGQTGLSSLTKGIVPKPTKMQEKSFQEFTGVPTVYRSLAGKTSESPFSLETKNEKAGKWMDYLGAASMFLPFKGGKSLGKSSVAGHITPTIPMKTLDDFGSDFIVGNYASPGTGLTSSSIFNLPHAPRGNRYVGSEASLSHNPFTAETTINSIYGLPGSNKTGMFGSALLEAMARGNKLVLSSDRSIDSEKLASVLSRKNLSDLIVIPKKSEATIDGLGPMPWAYSQSEYARLRLEGGLNINQTVLRDPKSFVPLHPDQISAASQATRLLIGGKNVDLKMLEDLLQQYISGGTKKFANGGIVNPSAISAPSVPYYMNMGGMIPGYHKGGPVGHRHGRNATQTSASRPYGPHVPTFPALRFNNNPSSPFNMPVSAGSTASLFSPATGIASDPRFRADKEEFDNFFPVLGAYGNLLLTPFTPSKAPSMNKQTEKSKYVRRESERAWELMHKINPAFKVGSWLVRPMYDAAINIGAGDGKWNDYTSIGSTYLGSGLYKNLGLAGIKGAKSIFTGAKGAGASIFAGAKGAGASFANLFAGAKGAGATAASAPSLVGPAAKRAVTQVPSLIKELSIAGLYNTLKNIRSNPIKVALHNAVGFKPPNMLSGFKRAYDYGKKGKSFFEDFIQNTKVPPRTGAPNVPHRTDAWENPLPLRPMEALGELVGLGAGIFKSKVVSPIASKTIKPAKELYAKFKKTTSYNFSQLKQFSTKEGFQKFIDYYTPIGSIKALREAKAAGYVRSSAPSEGGLDLPLPQLLQQMFYHGGKIPGMPLNRFLPGTPSDSGAIFGFDFFSSISPSVARSYALTKNAEAAGNNASVYETMFNFAKAKFLDLRGGQPSIFSQNKKAYFLLEKFYIEKFKEAKISEMAHAAQKMSPEEIIEWATKKAKDFLLGERVPGTAMVRPIDPQAPYSGAPEERSLKFWHDDLAMALTTTGKNGLERIIDTLVHHGGINIGGQGEHAVIASMRPADIVTRFKEALTGNVLKSTKSLASDPFLLTKILKQMLEQFSQTGVARPLIGEGHILTGKKPSDEFTTVLATGGYIDKGKVSIPKFHKGGMVGHKHTSKWDEFWSQYDNNRESVDKFGGTRKYTQGILKNILRLGPLGSQVAPVVDGILGKGKYDKGVDWLYNVGLKPIEEVIAGSGTKGDWANSLLTLGLPGVGGAISKVGMGAIKLGRAGATIGKATALETFEKIGNTLPLLKTFNPFKYSKDALHQAQNLNPLRVIDKSVLFPKITNWMMDSGVLAKTEGKAQYENIIELLNSLGGSVRRPYGLLDIPFIQSAGNRAADVFVNTPRQLSKEFAKTGLHATGLLKSLKALVTPYKKGIWDPGAMEYSSYVQKLGNPFLIKKYFADKLAGAKGYLSNAVDNPAFWHEGNGLYMPDWKGRYVKNAAGKIEGFLKHPHATVQTFLHELGHRDLDLFGDMGNLAHWAKGKIPGLNPDRASLHEFAADLFSHRGIGALRGKFQDKFNYVKSRWEEGGGYGLKFPSFPVGSEGFREGLLNNARSMVDSGLGSRAYQIYADWFKTQGAMMRLLVPGVGGAQADTFGVLGKLLAKYGVEIPGKPSQVAGLKAIGERLGLAIPEIVDSGLDVVRKTKPEKIVSAISKFPSALALPGYIIRALSNNSDGKDKPAKKKETVEDILARLMEGRIGFANGGMASTYNIPKFEKGINMVPANMLAMLHKNEAVVPANMNPFNPNAQTYSQPSVSYNIAPVINAAPGMDEQAIANMATRQVLAEIKVLDARNNASMGRPGMRVVGK